MAPSITVRLRVDVAALAEMYDLVNPPPFLHATLLAADKRDVDAVSAIVADEQTLASLAQWCVVVESRDEFALQNKVLILKVPEAMREWLSRTFDDLMVRECDGTMYRWMKHPGSCHVAKEMHLSFGSDPLGNAAKVPIGASIPFSGIDAKFLGPHDPFISKTFSSMS